MHITTLGIDVAKNVFQLHRVDARGRGPLRVEGCLDPRMR